MPEQKRTYLNALRYTVEGDNRVHTDLKKVMELRMQIPEYWEDTCPECGNKENISGCRCMLSHRNCPKCGFIWRWEVDMHRGIIALVV